MQGAESMPRTCILTISRVAVFLVGTTKKNQIRGF
jgi:hypothetical protein